MSQSTHTSDWPKCCGEKMLYTSCRGDYWYECRKCDRIETKKHIKKSLWEKLKGIFK